MKKRSKAASKPAKARPRKAVKLKGAKASEASDGEERDRPSTSQVRLLLPSPGCRSTVNAPNPTAGRLNLLYAVTAICCGAECPSDADCNSIAHINGFAGQSAKSPGPYYCCV
jgi:hypothetical protein